MAAICTITDDFNPGTWMLSFGTVCLGSHVDKVFRITNTGDGTLLGTITFSMNDGGFSILEDPAYNLGASEYKDFTLRFEPLSIGLKGCTLDTNNALCPDHVYGSGTGNDTPVAEITPASLAFGSICVGAYTDLNFTVKNVGCSTLSGTINETSETVDFTIQDSDPTYDLSPDEEKTFTIRFEPLSAGAKTGTIDMGNPLCDDVSCTGTGNDTAVGEVTPASLDFGAMESGDTADLTFRITNTGCGTLSGTISISSGSDHFSVIGDDSYSLGLDEYQNFTIRFAPDEPGILAGLVETGNALCDDVPLQGTVEEVESMMYFTYGSSGDEVTVYLRWAALVPYSSPEYEVPATVTRSEDLKLKVYGHALGGDRKRTFIISAKFKVMDEEGYRWIDLERFYNDTIKGPLKQFTFGDNFGYTYTVRMIQFGTPQWETRKYVKIRMVLEEDYT